MLVLRGAPALSGFRREKLLRRIEEQAGVDCRLTATLVHFVDLDRPLSDDAREVLHKLLTYGPAGRAPVDENQQDEDGHHAPQNEFEMSQIVT